MSTTTAVITGASHGLGRELARALGGRGWRLVIDARGAGPLDALRGELAEVTDVIALRGDVCDEEHRRALIDAASGPLQLLVNNASELGPSPLPQLSGFPLEELGRVYHTNVFAPLRLAQLGRPVKLMLGGITGWADEGFAFAKGAEPGSLQVPPAA